MQITVNWVNAQTNAQKSVQHRDNAPMKQAKVSAVLAFGIFPPQPGRYNVSASPDGDPVDERKKLDELGIADGATLYLRRAISPITMKWISKVNPAECEQICLPTDTLRSVEMEALGELGCSPTYEDLFAVSTTESGSPLDELKTLVELGIANDGQVVYSVNAPQAKIGFGSCVTGLGKWEQCGHTLVLHRAKLRVMPELDMDVLQEASFCVSMAPNGSPLDETKTMQELALTADNTVIYICERL